MTRSEPLSMRPIRGVAVDQGSGLARMLRQARGAKAGKGDLLLFKRLVAEQLSPEASTLPSVRTVMHDDCTAPAADTSSDWCRRLLMLSTAIESVTTSENAEQMAHRIAGLTPAMVARIG